MPTHSVSPAEFVAGGLTRWRVGERTEVLRTELLDVLASVPAPRDRRGRRYPLAGLLAIALLAVAAGRGVAWRCCSAWPPSTPTPRSPGRTDRYQATGTVDWHYLGELSADAVPVIATLPQPLAECALAIDGRERDDWLEWNLGRSQARAFIETHADDWQYREECPGQTFR